MNLEKILQNQGLSEKEARVYLILLELHEALPSTISRKSGIKRPTTYVILDQLMKQGLVSHVKRGPNLYYQASNPKQFLDDQENKFHELKRHSPSWSISINSTLRHLKCPFLKGKTGLYKSWKTPSPFPIKCSCAGRHQLDLHCFGGLLPHLHLKGENKVQLKGIFPYEKEVWSLKKRKSRAARSSLDSKRPPSFKTKLTFTMTKWPLFHTKMQWVLLFKTKVSRIAKEAFLNWV